MKKLLVLLAVTVLTTSTSGCTSLTECANISTCNCCKRLRDWCFRGAYCNQNMAAVTAPVYAAPATTYATGPPQTVATPAPMVAAPAPMIAAPPAMIPQQVVMPQQMVIRQPCIPQQCVPYVISDCQTCYPSSCCPPCYGCDPCGCGPRCDPGLIYDSGSSIGCGCQSGFTNNEVGTIYEGSPVTSPEMNQLDPTPIDE